MPEAVRQKAISRGAEGWRWLDRLGGLIREIERGWSVTVGSTFRGGSESYVAAARTRAGDAAVVKLEMPPYASFASKDRTLIATEGRWYARLLEHDEERSAMLQERLRPSLRGFGRPIPTPDRDPLRDAAPRLGHAGPGGSTVRGRQGSLALRVNVSGEVLAFRLHSALDSLGQHGGSKSMKDEPTELGVSMSVRIASCSCGQLRAEVRGEPSGVSVCHCYACQRRTGSVFSAQAGFPREAVAVEGAGTEFVRVGDEGGRFKFTFCPECGSTVFYVEEGDEQRIAIPVGAFADSSFPAPTVSVYEERRHSWVSLPDGVEHWRKDPE